MRPMGQMLSLCVYRIIWKVFEAASMIEKVLAVFWKYCLRLQESLKMLSQLVLELCEATLCWVGSGASIVEFCSRVP